MRIETQWDGSFDPIEFCRVGRSVQVSYSRSAKPLEGGAKLVPSTATALNR